MRFSLRQITAHRRRIAKPQQTISPPPGNLGLPAAKRHQRCVVSIRHVCARFTPAVGVRFDAASLDANCAIGWDREVEDVSVLYVSENDLVLKDRGNEIITTRHADHSRSLPLYNLAVPLRHVRRAALWTGSQSSKKKV
jgi:hypothetical protein